MDIEAFTLRQDQSPGTSGGSAFATSIIRSKSGNEQRLIRFTTPQSVWKLMWSVERSQEVLGALIDRFLQIFGMGKGFYFVPPYGVSASDETPAPLGSNHYQLCRRNMSGPVTMARNITWVTGDVTLRQGKDYISGGSYSVDNATGILTYAGYKPIDLFWCIDLTAGGSFTPYGGDIFEAIQTAAERVNTRINALSASNRMGVVTFEATAATAQALTTNLATVNGAIAGLSPVAATADIAAGITQVRSALEGSVAVGHVPCVILIATGESATDPTSAVAAMLAANPSWVFVTICLNDANGSRASSFASESALMAALGDLGLGSHLAQDAATAVNAGQETLGLCFGASVTSFGIPVRMTVDQMKGEQKGLQFGWSEITLAEVRQVGSYTLTLQDDSLFDHYVPERYAAGSRGGPGFQTLVTSVQSGFVDSYIFQENALRQYNVSWQGASSPEGLSIESLEGLAAFFECRLGRARPFLFEDTKDYALEGQLLGTGDDVQVDFQITKTYPLSGVVRTITKPKPGTVSVSVDAIALIEWVDYTVDYTTGVITFSVAPGMDLDVTCTSEFYVPARFDKDEFEGKVSSLLASWQNVPIVEVRE